MGSADGKLSFENPTYETEIDSGSCLVNAGSELAEMINRRESTNRKKEREFFSRSATMTPEEIREAFYEHQTDQQVLATILEQQKEYRQKFQGVLKLYDPITKKMKTATTDLMQLEVKPMESKRRGRYRMTDESWCWCGINIQDKMIECGNNACPKEWFHLSCAALSEVPKGDWFCSSDCKDMAPLAGKKLEDKKIQKKGWIYFES